MNAASSAETVSIEALSAFQYTVALKMSDHLDRPFTVASTRPASPPKTTPLLEALKAEKQAQKDKEAIIRNHAHYKELMSASTSGALRKEEKRKAAPPTAGKKGKKAAAPPAPPKQIQIQAKPSTSGGSAQNANAVVPQPSKPQPPPSRPSRSAKHAAKAAKEANAAPALAPKDAPQPSANRVPDATVPAPPPAQDTTAPTPASSAAPAKRGRPVLGLGSRHFEAALSGVVTGERKRRDKGKESATTTPSASATPATPQENIAQEKPAPPTSPRRPRHRKDAVANGTASAATSAGPDANGASVLAVPVTAQVDGGGPPPHTNGGGRGGRRGRGRGRGGPPRVG